jgi:solute carrier family 6 GABA transporter-like protein 1
MNAIRNFGSSVASAPRRMAELGPKGIAKSIASAFAPPPSKAADGRDQWPSRTAFVLAAMGGCAGMGNLLRYPSQVYNNHGLQWYIPYLMCVFLIAIPVLVLEIAIGNAYRGGCVVAYNSLNHRLKGTGLAMLYVGFVVGPYFVANLAWIMIYFRHSFTSPLPWAGRPQEFYEEVVGINPVPTPGNYTSDGTSIVDWVQYNGTRIMPETVGWTIFTWFLVWISIFKGTGLTGRVVYFTMGLPVVITIILIGRSCSLPNAVDGVKLYFATWRGEELAKGAIWQTACGQVFFSTGVGFGYFTSYASYNKKHSNAVLDSILVVSSNVLFENIAAFAVFGVVGFLGMYPDPANPIGGFTVGFLTLPEAVVSMPASNFWAVMLFFTLMTLGYSSAFAMLDAVVTLIMDAWPRLNRTIVVTSAVVVSFLLSLPYCTEFGYYLLSGIDRWTNDIALVFVVWSECVCATVVYRWQDVAAQVGKPAWITYTATYFASQVLGCVVAQTVNAPAGAAVGFGIYIVGSTVTVLISKNPQEPAPSFWGKNKLVSRFWYVALYSVSKTLCTLAITWLRSRSFLALYPNRVM